MRNKLILFLMLALFGSISFLRADELTIGFETGDLSEYAFVNDETHPWVVTSDDSNTGTYCMMSSNGGISSSSSTIEATVEFSESGTISFAALCMGEGAYTPWDKCMFKIDGEQQFAYGSSVSGWNDYSYTVPAGTHTFTWTYSKDSSVNPTGDYFMVDDITFTGVGNSGGGGGGGSTTPIPEFTPWVMGDPNVEMTTLELLSPEFGAMNVGNPVYLQWITDPNAAEYKIEFGSDYLPGVFVDWTPIDETYPADPSYIDVTEYMVPSTHYFWRISIRNNVSELTSDWYGFTTTLQPPTQVQVTEEQIFTDGSTLVKWKGASTGGAGFSGEITVADGTVTNSYIPVYGLWVDDYTRSEMIYPAEMLEEMEGGEITSLTFYIATSAAGPWSPAVFNVYMMEVENTTLTSYYTSADAEIVYTGGLDGQGSTMVINLSTPYTYTGGNLLVGIEETTEGTYKSCYFYGITSNGSSASGYSSAGLSGVTFNQRNFLPKTTFTCGGKGGDRTIRGFNVYYVNGDAEPVKANTELITEKQYTLTNLPYNVDPGLDIHVTAVYDEGESDFDNGQTKVQVSGYGTFNGTVTELNSGEAIEGVNVKFAGKDEFNNNAVYQTTTDASGHYTIENVKAGNYSGTASLEGFENAYSESVTLAYETTETVDFVMHEVYNPVFKVYAQELDPSTAKVTWSMHDFVNPTPGGGGGGGGGSATTFTEGFEGGLPSGWNVIDANNDGYTWCLTSAIPTTWTYYASLSLDWYRTGTNAICSGSYINGAGALTPDEYLVMPQVTLAAGSTLTFWAAAADASYPADHFGVFVSDNGTSDWTKVEEWTLTGKSGGTDGGRASRDGKGAKLGTWHQFTADLSAYAGQKYIAIRHFNCNDQYIMVVDDIELSAGKGTRDVAYYNVYRKAILKENGVAPEDSLKLAGNLPITDTLYADFDWNNVEPGLYQYGVQAVYPGGDAKGNNREEVTIGEPTTTTAYLPTYNLYNYSFTEQIYTAEEIGGSGVIESISFNPVGSITRNLNIYMVNTEKTAFSGTNDWIAVTADDLVYSGPVAMTANSWTTVTLTNSFLFDGTNLAVVVCDVTGTWTSSIQYNAYNAASQAIYIYQDAAPYDPTNPSYNGTVTNVKNNIKLDITYGGLTSNDDPNTGITWSNILPKDMKTAVTVNAYASTGSVLGATVTLTNLNENLNYNGTIDSTGSVVFEDFRKGEYKVTAALEGMASDLTEAEFSIWDETTIEAHFTEILAPVTNLVVSGTGYARWTDMIPAAGEVAERYIVNMNDALQGQTTNNFMQLNTEGLTVGETYEAKVAVIYTTGMSPWTTANFTYIGCDAVGTQVDSLWYDEIPDGSMDIVLNWNTAGGTGPTPPAPPTGDVVIKLTAHNVWGDGTGYQMLLDDTHSLYGTTIPTSGALSSNCTGNDAIYAQFSHKIPTNADGECSTSNMVLDGTVEITVPAGTYDWCITNPTPGDRIWIAAGNGNVGGRYDDYVFEGGHTYEFTISMYGSNDGVDVTITGGKGMNQPNMGLMSLDNRTNNNNRGGNLSNAGVGLGNSNNSLTDDGNWYYYDNGVNEDAIGTGGGNFWWGIMLPAGSYEGSSLTKVAAYDYMAMTGNVNIYQGGNAAPSGSSLGQTNVSFTGSGDFVEFTFADPITLDPSQNVWVIFYNGSGATYPAAVCSNTGDANGRWVSLDGSSWADLASYGLDYTFMVRAYIESVGGGGGTGVTTYQPGKFNILVDGEVVGATSDNTYTVTATDYDEHLYEVVYVDANYNISCPMGLLIRVPLTSVGSNEIVSSVYPNPTSGDLHIKAYDMVRVSVLNTLGQILFDQAVKGDEIILNMARYEAGVYMINITTNNGTSVKRVVVTK